VAFDCRPGCPHNMLNNRRQMRHAAHEMIRNVLALSQLIG
jgi:hypothetical protein